MICTLRNGHLFNIFSVNLGNILFLNTVSLQKKGDISPVKGKSNEQNSIYLVRWNNNIVACAQQSSVQSLQRQLIGGVAQNQKIQVPRPFFVKIYNETMGGTDGQDQHVNKCRIGITGKNSDFPYLLGC